MTCLDDDMVLGLVEGRLAPPVLATVDEHLDTCASCRDVVTQVARSLSPARPLERGQTVGRYVIGDLVGAGAMGRVYSAWEPELDRRVALKLLATSDAGARDRVIREAKAMAKLDHPNVVGVHEVGTADDAVYVAMELVDGETLRAYSTTPHPWRETAALLADIARGLAAVHAAGVIHRDVKPDNIVVGHDRRARIADFGLARSSSSPSSPAQPSLAAGSIDAPALGTGLAGTPAYMAPEVASGSPATAASDQFGFGVTAYEALSGSRPFTATTFSQLREAYRSSTIAPLRDVPSWLDAAIRRCLSIDPAGRFPSLIDFADVIARGLHRRQGPRLLIGGIAAAALLASGATYLALRQPAAGPSCSAGASEIAEVWNADTRARLAAIGEPSLRALDSWATAWATEKDTTCRASEYEPPAMTAARNRCLDRRREEAAALIAVLSQPPGPSPSQPSGASSMTSPSSAPPSSAPPSSAPPSSAPPSSAPPSSAPPSSAPPSTASTAPSSTMASSSARDRLIDALAGLSSPDECAAAANDPADAVPLDPSRAAIVTEVQHQLASLRATLALGDARPVLDATTKLVETARSSQHAPTLAEAELLHADALRATSQLDAAVDSVRAAAADAERGHADQLAARIWLARVAIAGDRRDLASADDLISIASGAIDRAGAPKRLVASLLKLRGLVAYNRGKLDDARKLLTDAHTMLVGLSTQIASSDMTASRGVTASSDVTVSSHERATIATGSSDVALLETDLNATIERIAVESALGSVERAAGNLDAAEQWHQRAFDADRALRGDVHPDIARDLHNLAGVARLRGDLAVAFERYFKALAIEIATRGEGSVEAGLTHNSLGLVALERADNWSMVDRGGSLAMRDPRVTIERPQRKFDPVRLDEARAQFTLARDIFVAANHGDRAFAEHNLGLVDAAAGDHTSAIAHFDAASAIYATTIGSSSDAAKRLLEDRAVSERALRGGARTTNNATTNPAATNPTATNPTATNPTNKATTPSTSVGVEPKPVITGLSPAPPVPTPPPAPKANEPRKLGDPPKRDVGVYGSTQSW